MKVLRRIANKKAFTKLSTQKKERDAIYVTEDEKHLVTDNPVINEPRYFNIFESGKNNLNSIDTTCERACMETSKYKYYTEMYNTLTD